jgi:hypothetical protein
VVAYRKVAPRIILVAYKLRALSIIYRYNISLWILFVPINVPYVRRVGGIPVLESERRAGIVINVDYKVAARFLGNNQRAVKVVGSLSSVLGLARSYSRIVVGKGVDIAALCSTGKLPSRPRKGCALFVACNSAASYFYFRKRND